MKMKMKMVNKLVETLGVFSVYLDEEKQIKVDVEFLPGDDTFVYFSDQELEKLMNWKEENQVQAGDVVL
jgi:hypothetical protein